MSGATGALVSSITYTGNTVTSAAKYGVVIQQDYENGSPTGTPTNGVSISDINFTGTNTVSAAASGKEVYVLCGKFLTRRRGVNQNDCSDFASLINQEAGPAKEPGTGPVSKSAAAPRAASLVSQKGTAD